MKKILLIEDHPPMRENLILMLEMEGFKVLWAENGRQGIGLAQSELPHLILCDVMMPDLDGYEVLKALRASPATTSIPFIFLTAKGEKVDQRAGMNLGADDYLVKPVGKAEVLAAIAARLQRQEEHDHRAQVLVNQVEFYPDFSSAVPLESLGISTREAEVLLWIAQGKNNEEIAIILGASRNTIKKHVVHLLAKLGVESRNAAAVRAFELLSRPKTKRAGV
jgi:DNA-binding NarL/FixJ family response regulator